MDKEEQWENTERELERQDIIMKEITKQRICDTIADAISQGVTAGVNLLVLKDGRELFYTEQGMADREAGKPIRRDSIFRLYSMSKPVTAAAAVILVDRGLLDPGQFVADILPGFSNLMTEKNGTIVPAESQMTVHHLLNMTSGLTYGDDLSTVNGRATTAYIAQCVERLHTDQAVTTQEFASHMGTLPLAFDPDSSWCYGLSADVLGAVIEKVSGVSFGEFLQENLFEPLRMKDTGFWVPAEKQDRLAKAYETIGNGKMKLYTGDNLAISNAMDCPPAFESGGAGLVSTVDDYSRFAQMLLAGGTWNGKEILSPAAVAYLTDGCLTDVQQAALRKWTGLEGFTYSHLMRVMKHPEMACGLAREGEYGWDGWLGCYFSNFPNEKLTMIMMQQKKDSGTIPMTRKIRNIFLSDSEITG